MLLLLIRTWVSAQSWFSKNINQHLIVLMKLPNLSVKIRYISFPCLTNSFPWLKGTFWLRSRQWISIISSTNIKLHREVDVLITFQSHIIIHYRIQWKPWNPKIHYTQICKVSHGYIERGNRTKITKWNPYMAQIIYKQRSSN